MVTASGAPFNVAGQSCPKRGKYTRIMVCLLKYLMPLDLNPVKETEKSLNDERYRMRLNIYFIEDNLSAYRFVYTLKGVGGIMSRVGWQAGIAAIGRNGKSNSMS